MTRPYKYTYQASVDGVVSTYVYDPYYLYLTGLSVGTTSINVSRYGRKYYTINVEVKEIPEPQDFHCEVKGSGRYCHFNFEGADSLSFGNYNRSVVDKVTAGYWGFAVYSEGV